MENHDECTDESLFVLQGLNEIRQQPGILERLKLDVTPEMVMEPRFQSQPEDLKKLREISGYMFYVESECEPPALMLLKVGKTDVTSTIAKIDDIPRELIRKAIENPEHKPVNGMYAITGEIKTWLKRELNL